MARAHSDFAATDLFADLGLAVVDPTLRSHRNLLRSPDVGVASLSMRHAVVALENAGLVEETTLSDLPASLLGESTLGVFWAALDSLEDAAGVAQDQAPWRARLKACAIAPTVHGTLAPFSHIITCDSESRDTFSKALERAPFAALGTPADNLVLRLCRSLTPRRGVDLLAQALSGGASLQQEDAVALLQWFARHENALADEDLRDGIAALPLFPSVASDSLGPLDGLALPSGFEDPLGIAQLVDTHALEGLERFLRLLGAQELDLHHYVVEQLKQAFHDWVFEDEELKSLLTFLAAHLTTLEDDDEARDVLADLPLLRNDDGLVLRPLSAYFPSKWVKRVLPGIETVIHLDSDSPSLKTLLAWLGLASKPRVADVMTRIAALSTGPVTDEAVANAQEIVRLMIENGADDVLVGAAGPVRRSRLAPSRWRSHLVAQTDGPVHDLPPVGLRVAGRVPGSASR